MIGISMRRMRWLYPSGNMELRDGLDISWWNFLQLALPDTPYIPLPNTRNGIGMLLQQLPFCGFILTGGDDPGVFPERDAVETAIFEYAYENNIPVLGVCRGAQLMNILHGGSLNKVASHCGCRHIIFRSGSSPVEVNSWHSYGIGRLGRDLISRAVDEKGNVEAYTSVNGLINGIMWHPEREKEPDPEDIAFIGKLFNRRCP